MKNIPCAKCGSCTSVCPVYQVSGKESDTARGRLHLLEKLAGTAASKEYIEIFSRCLLCNACKAGCPRGIDLPSMVISARQKLPVLTGKGAVQKKLVEKSLASEGILKGISSVLKLSQPLLKILPANSGLWLKLGLLTESSTEHSHPSPTTDIPGKESSEQIMIFKGCLASHVYPGVASACDKLLAERSLSTHAPPQHCCGLAIFSGGDLETAKDLARKNIAAFENSEAKILTPCASCYSHLNTYTDLLGDDPEWNRKAIRFVKRLEEFSSFLSDNYGQDPATADDRSRKTRVLYHDPCHLRFRSGDFTSPPRKLLASRDDVELVELPHGSRCCGLGGLFNLAHPDLSDQIASELLHELHELRPDIIVSTCSGCLLQLKFLIASQNDMETEILHLAEFMSDKDP